MGILGELQEEMKLLDKAAEHDGYRYSVSGVMTILVCGMPCGLRLIDDIVDWAKAAPTRVFLEAQFGITKNPVPRAVLQHTEVRGRGQVQPGILQVDGDGFWRASHGEDDSHRRENRARNRQADQGRECAAHSDRACVRAEPCDGQRWARDEGRREKRRVALLHLQRGPWPC